MGTDLRKWLHDALEASRHIEAFVFNKTREDFANDILLRSAVERQFEIVGEALKRVRDKDESRLEPISGWRGAISFRNILTHGYDSVDDDLVWGIIKDDLPLLISSIASELKRIS